MLTRAAAVLAALLLAGALAATFLPSSPQGATCGTWVSPEWSDEEVEELIGRARDVAENPLSQYLDESPTALAIGVARSKRLCDDALGTRRTISLTLIGAALLVPAALIFVGRGARRA